MALFDGIAPFVEQLTIPWHREGWPPSFWAAAAGLVTMTVDSKAKTKSDIVGIFLLEFDILRIDGHIGSIGDTHE
jgi:hypothetical protein